jgi:large subunit ribosomal protein L4
MVERSDSEHASTTADVYNLQGDTVGSVDLPAEWFDGKVNVAVMHEVVTAQLAAARQGTHKTKTRGEVRGGGRKPWRQKGTGRARQGSIRSPQWVGGGVAHGRVPKDWSKRVNKKVKRAALRSALTDRAQSGDVRVVRDLAFDTPRTRDAVAALTALGQADRPTLVVLADMDQATVKSFRNLQGVHTIVVDQLNTYDVVRHHGLVIDEAALALIGTGRRASTATDTAQPQSEPTAVERESEPTTVEPQSEPTTEEVEA